MTDDEKAYAAYKIISDQIVKEDNLINHRVTWAVTLNGALLTLIAIMFSLTKDVPRVIPIVGFVSVALALLAVWICYVTVRHIRAARKQISYVELVYIVSWKDTIENKLMLPRPLWKEGGNTYQGQENEKLKIVGSEQLFIAIGLLWIAVLALVPLGITLKSLIFP